MEIKSHRRTYEVVFAEQKADVIKELSHPLAYVVADPVALALLGPKARASLSVDRLLLVEPSEELKTMDQAQKMVAWLVDAKARKNCRLVALGGGVIQDLTAFTASILYRGVDWVFVPTTLLAQADSCIGSKTSINVRGSKNIVGSFYPPSRVVVYPGFLDSLPDLEVRSGIGEILHFLVYGASPLLEPMIEEYDWLLVERHRLEPYIAESLRIKKAVVELDEFDRGERNKFNYGHTFGHAIEALTDFAIRHGQAVTVGMDIANYLSTKMGLLSSQEDGRLHRLLTVNFPDFDWRHFDVDRYMTFLSKDKKNIDSDLTCVLCEGVGRLTMAKIPMDDGFRRLIEEYFRTRVAPG